METHRKTHITRQLVMLSDMTVSQLLTKYVEVFGEPSRSRHKDFLRKRIAWRIQAEVHGDLSERARRRAEELANDADLRIRMSTVRGEPLGQTTLHAFKPTEDRRLPIPGSVITRDYHGRKLLVTVLDKGFEFEGAVYKSLTAVAKAATGAHWNGPLFFGLKGKEAA
jgi:hypothetical protein